VTSRRAIYPDVFERVRTYWGIGVAVGQQPGCPSAVQVSSGTPLGKLNVSQLQQPAQVHDRSPTFTPILWQAESLVHEASPISTELAALQALIPTHELDPMVRYEVEVPVATEHAPFPRHEPFPMVAYFEVTQAPWSNVPPGSETQESVPTLVKRAAKHAPNPWHD